MLRGLDAAASGMLANQARQDALTNNLANVNTPGYKADNSTFRTFPEVLLERIRDNGGGVAGLPAFPGPQQIIGKLAHGVYNQELVPNFIQGDVTETGKVLDVAMTDGTIAPKTVTNADGTTKQVQPKMFFAIQKPAAGGQPAETLYTRSGNWTMSAEGFLTTQEGYQVLDSSGKPINLARLLQDPAGRPMRLSKENLQISPTGQLTVAGNPAATAQLRMVRVDDPAANMIKEMDTTFRYTGAGAPAAYNPTTDLGVAVKQGYTERSNVDAGQTMIDMMNVIRSYESNQRVLEAYDTTLQKLNEVGRIG